VILNALRRRGIIFRWIGICKTRIHVECQRGLETATQGSPGNLHGKGNVKSALLRAAVSFLSYSRSLAALAKGRSLDHLLAVPGPHFAYK
jgi:hypothetical protein